MGRRPNPLILEYFVRGPKLQDNSNRYPHTCKQCGENFPKGRNDSLTTHITKKCPAISDSDRMRACLELHGIATARVAAAKRNHQNGQMNRPQGSNTGLPDAWSALETLAEASRQVDLNESSRVREGQYDASNSLNTSLEDHGMERFELQEPFTLDNPPMAFDDRIHTDKPHEHSQTHDGMSAEERLQAFISHPAENGETDPTDTANLSVAAAATARLIDPQLVPSEPITVTSSPPKPSNEPEQQQQQHQQQHTEAITIESSPPPEQHHQDTDMTTVESNLELLGATTGAQQPWGEMTYQTTPTIVHPQQPFPPSQLVRGGVRMIVGNGSLDGKSRHARSHFTAERRKEVQEVRKIGACIRCRILRKSCGQGSPCDTCRKVLHPRVWKTGCVRTRLQEQLDLYSAGVQVVLSQNRINMLKSHWDLRDTGTMIEASHFPQTGITVSSPTLVSLIEPSENQAAAHGSEEPFEQIMMIDQDGFDLPTRVEMYTRAMLPHFIDRESSKYMKTTLETAQKRLNAGEDALLLKALELWSLVESIDRERQWSVTEKPSKQDAAERLIVAANSESDEDIYTMITHQLNAAAERKANTTSQALLSLMHRQLQDSKVGIGFNMFLTALIFVNCCEKSTWSFKAWEQDDLRHGWPLERNPGEFLEQGDVLASLLRMLLSIRKALPRTARSKEGKLVAHDKNDDLVREYFEAINLDYDYVESRQKGTQFLPADSRSLELTFSAQILLPDRNRD